MKKFKLILNIILILFLTISKSYSLVEVDITRGNLNPLPIAVSPLFQDNNSNTFFEKELEIDFSKFLFFSCFKVSAPK